MKYVNGHNRRDGFGWLVEDRGFETPCHIWQGNVTPGGYGRAEKTHGLRTLAHRQTWINERGEIPDGLSVLHRCDVRSCVRLDHLFLGTQKDNMHDMVEKGRHRNASTVVTKGRCPRQYYEVSQ